MLVPEALMFHVEVVMQVVHAMTFAPENVIGAEAVTDALVRKPGLLNPITLPPDHVTGDVAVIDAFVRKPGLAKLQVKVLLELVAITIKLPVAKLKLGPVEVVFTKKIVVEAEPALWVRVIEPEALVIVRPPELISVAGV